MQVVNDRVLSYSLMKTTGGLHKLDLDLEVEL